MGDAYFTSNGSRSVRPSACTRLMRYLPSLRAAAVAASLVSKAVLPSFHVIEIGQNVANLKYPVFVRLAVVCMMAAFGLWDGCGGVKIVESIGVMQAQAVEKMVL